MNILLTFFSILAILLSVSCRRSNTDYVTVALSEPFSSFDTLTSDKSDSAAERVKNLMFNSLVKKSETFDYIGELASEIKSSEDGKAITFILRPNIKFHNGSEFTSADVKYTFDELLNSSGFKKFAFYDTVNKAQIPHIESIVTPDKNTVVFNISKPSLKNQLLSNLVAIPIIPQGSVGQQKTSPIGSGPYKFVSFDQSQNIVSFESNVDYWEGAPKVSKLRVKTISDASALQAELQNGAVDIAPLPTNLPPDTLNALSSSDKLNVEQFPGSNIQYVGINTQTAPLNNVKIRQAIGYAIDRDKIIKELLLGQARVANSILPDTSWAFTPGTEYRYDPEMAKKLISEAGYKNEPIKFKFTAGNAFFSSYSQAIQSSLIAVGLNVEIETLDSNTLREDLAKGRFMLNTGVWIGGNQDPIFIKDLFTTGRIPGEGVSCCNRSRYSNTEVDNLVESAMNEVDRAKAAELYKQAWQKISSDLPLLPLWYPANMVVANKRIGNIKVNASGDWSFLKDITVN